MSEILLSQLIEGVMIALGVIAGAMLVAEAIRSLKEE